MLNRDLFNYGLLQLTGLIQPFETKHGLCKKDWILDGIIAYETQSPLPCLKRIGRKVVLKYGFFHIMAKSDAPCFSLKDALPV